MKAIAEQGTDVPQANGQIVQMHNQVLNVLEVSRELSAQLACIRDRLLGPVPEKEESANTVAEVARSQCDELSAEIDNVGRVIDEALSLVAQLDKL